MIDEEYILLHDFYFDSIDEFCAVNSIASNSNNFEEITPEWYYSNHAGSTERWFKYNPTQETYILIDPDPPLTGLWEKIDPASPPVYGE
jgi:hypothetical protein